MILNSKRTVLLILMFMVGAMQAWGETETKTEGFETANTSSNNINSISSEESDCGIEWTLYYGHITSSKAINGKSCFIRWYSSNPTASNYAQTTTPIKGLTNITFKAKHTSSIISMYVSYSTDGTKWTTWKDGAFSSNGNDWIPFTNVERRSLSTDPYYFSYYIPNSSPNTDYYIRIMVVNDGLISGNADLIIDDVVFTYTKSDEVTVADGQTLAINTPTELEKLTIEPGGKIGGEAALTVKDLILKSSLGAISGASDHTDGKCGEIANSHISASGDVFLELDLTPAAEASYGWYAFSVPFAVSATDGIYFGETKLTNGSDYAIMAYRGDIRAQGQYAWVKHSGDLQPGILYIISVGDTDYKTLRFKKQPAASLYNDVITGSNQMATQEFASSNADHAGWNGLGNPYLETAHIESSYLQFLDHEANTFKVRSGDDVKLMVGSAFFYQSDGSAITVTKEKTGSIALVPAHTPSAMEQTTYEVRLLNANGKEEDRLFLRASEEATDSYEIGRDVAKLSMGDARCAQIWIPAYGTQLCAADFPIENGQATYPLTLHAPAAGTYSIAMQTANGAELYLTKDGAVMWDLSKSTYTIELAQGTNEGYGLLLKMPQTPTGIESISDEGLAIRGAQKVIIDGRMYLVREGRMFDALGILIK